MNAENELFADACRRSFYCFAQYGFGIRNYMREHPETRWMTERLHKPLCGWFEWHVRDWLQSRELRQRRKKLMVVWPRSFGKTTLLTKAGNTWVHLQNPDLATAISSVVFKKSEEFLGAIRDTLDGTNPYAWFTALYGNWVSERLWRANALTHRARVAHGRSEASFEVTSVETGLTGKHPDLVFIDDPVTREKLRDGDNWHKLVNDHCESLIPVVPPNGMIVACATRYADHDWLGRLMRDEGVRSVDGMTPRESDFKLDKDGQWDLYLMRARTDLGDPVLPEVWGEVALRDYERKNPLDFAAQMMNEPGEGEHMPLTRAQIDEMWVDEREVPQNLRYSVHLDTAFKDGDRLGRGDYNAICVWGHHPGSGVVYFIEGVRSNQMRSEDFVDKLIVLLQKYKMNRKQIFAITDEPSAGKGDTFQLYLMGACHAVGLPMPPFNRINRTTKKEARIREAAMYWADGRVRLLRNAPEVQHLTLEMLRIGVSAHDDMADASADVFHPDIYHAQRLGGEVTNRGIVRPWDEYLKTGRVTTSLARDLYDEVNDTTLNDLADEGERFWRG